MNIKGLKKVGLGGLINSASIEKDGSFRLKDEGKSVVVIGTPFGQPIEESFGIYDLSRFMSVARMLSDDATWMYDKNSESLVVKDSKKKFTYKVNDSSMILHAYNPSEEESFELVTPETTVATISIAQDVRKDLLNAIRIFEKEPAIVIEDREDGVCAVFGNTFTQEIILKLSDTKMNRSALLLPTKIISQILAVVDSEPLQIAVGSGDLPVMISDTYVKFYVFPVIM